VKKLMDPRKIFGEAVVEAGERFENVIALSADSGGGSGMAPFREKFPDRYKEFGIMEQGVMGFASGLSLMGKIPFFAAISPFITGRAFEMFRNDVGYMGQNVKAVGRCSGLAFSNLGPTHLSHDDVALIRTIPGVTVVAPGDPVDINRVVHAACEHYGPMYIRIGSQPMPVLLDNGYKIILGKGVLMKDGTDVTIIGSGTVLSKAYEAAEKLKKQGISARLIYIHTIKPIDEELIIKAAQETGKLVTVEEHSVIGGLGSAVAEVVSKSCPVSVRMVGLQDIFASNGPYEELLEVYGLQAQHIVQTTMDFLR